MAPASARVVAFEPLHGVKPAQHLRFPLSACSCEQRLESKHFSTTLDGLSPYCRHTSSRDHRRPSHPSARAQVARNHGGKAFQAGQPNHTSHRHWAKRMDLENWMSTSRSSFKATYLRGAFWVTFGTILTGSSSTQPTSGCTGEGLRVSHVVPYPCIP